MLESDCRQPSVNKEAFLKKWWDEIDSETDGKITLIQSCGRNESASEACCGDKQFGLFTRSMLDAACKLTSSDILSVEKAFVFAKGQVQHHCKSQMPVINSSSKYPFSIKTTASKSL